MKILVISDTHGNIEHAKRIIEDVIPAGVKVILHCGDYISDARLLQKFYPEVEVFGVYGNCDVGFGGEYDRIVEVEGVPIYMSHGHRYGVKWGDYEEVWIDTVAQDAMVAVCGHSHEAYLDQKAGVILMNPGSISKPRDSKYPSYGILEVQDGEITGAHIMQIHDNGVIKEHPVSDIFRIK